MVEAERHETIPALVDDLAAAGVRRLHVLAWRDLDDPDAGDDAGAHGEVGAPSGQRHQLEEGRALVEQQLDAFAGQQLAALRVARVVLLAAAGDRLRMLGIELGQLLEHRLPSSRHVIAPFSCRAGATCPGAGGRTRRLGRLWRARRAVSAVRGGHDAPSRQKGVMR